MDNKTYEVLKRVMKTLGKFFDNNKFIEDSFEAKDLNDIEGWIVRMAKKYEDE